MTAGLHAQHVGSCPHMSQINILRRQSEHRRFLLPQIQLRFVFIYTSLCRGLSDVVCRDVLADRRGGTPGWAGGEQGQAEAPPPRGNVYRSTAYATSQVYAAQACVGGCHRTRRAGDTEPALTRDARRSISTVQRNVDNETTSYESRNVGDETT